MRPRYRAECATEQLAGLGEVRVSKTRRGCGARMQTSGTANPQGAHRIGIATSRDLHLVGAALVKEAFRRKNCQNKPTS